MPLPKPRSEESRDDFISRCMGGDAIKEFKDQKQRVAVCFSQWKKAKSEEIELTKAEISAMVDEIMEKYNK